MPSTAACYGLSSIAITTPLRGSFTACVTDEEWQAQGGLSNMSCSVERLGFKFRGPGGEPDGTWRALAILTVHSCSFPFSTVLMPAS